MHPAVDALKSRLTQIDDLRRAASVLEWDQHTLMPEGGAAARGRQLATLRRLAHDLEAADETQALVDGAGHATDGRDPGDPERALYRVGARKVARARKVPSELVNELETHLSASYDAWTRARPDGDFETMRPYLERTVELSRRWADAFPGADHPADPAVAESDPGMSVAQIQALFGELRAELVPLISAIGSAPRPDGSFLVKSYDEDAQLAFGREVVQGLGYDFRRGRSDLTHHPFMTKFGSGDVRITTRVQKNDFSDALFSTIHECGHALYEQNIDASFDGTPLDDGTSSGVHESQSRLWENIVGRSRGFWEHMLPVARARFPEQLGDVSVDAFYRAINRVEPSLIRTDADEVTYNLHVMIRFDLATALLEGKLLVKDLPDAWNARYEADLGVRAPTPTDGVLQDVHWYVDKIGGLFQGYALGNVMSAQFYDAACRADPSIPARIRAGDYAPLRRWLVDHVYRHGSVYDPNDLLERSTGEALSITPFIRYLKQKFGTLYSLEFDAPAV